jgi:putative endonuclease
LSYFAYILRCADNSLYSGYTTDPIAREKTHNSAKGAKYTRSRLPVKLVYVEEYADKSSALKREAALKRLSHAEKEKLIALSHEV